MFRLGVENVVVMATDDAGLERSNHGNREGEGGRGWLGGCDKAPPAPQMLIDLMVGSQSCLGRRSMHTYDRVALAAFTVSPRRWRLVHLHPQGISE